ncbi:hypothetical protein SteCoe_7166 [Stentor coeruleus]|uniref:Uncharacterized protein n=1 Tax=Stentor coeruleus TaxID=5963 RepID=A0A1R2CN59_9CILI|nr:hypothetical protein SteCoe_7166 [Stentor coeruleus]
MDIIAYWDNLRDLKPSQIPTKGYLNDLCISKDWVFYTTQDSLMYVSNKTSSALPKVLLTGIQIKELACNLFMAMFLTTQGEIFGYGHDEMKSGLFGVQNLYTADRPIKIDVLCQIKLESISLSRTHAGGISQEGLLYTWGQGLNGELGDLDLTTSFPKPVKNANFFKSTSLSCGFGFTAVCTEAGFLYIFSIKKPCEKCKKSSSYPYSIKSLQNEFFVNLKSYGDDLIAVNDVGKCFVISKCFCVANLPSKNPIDQIAICEIGIVGLSSNHRVLYVWKKGQKIRWLVEFYTLLGQGEVFQISSGVGKAVGIIGINLNAKSLKQLQIEPSSVNSPSKISENERKSFEEIVSSLGFKGKIGLKDPNKLLTTLDNLFKSKIRQTLKDLWKLSYYQSIYKKAYSAALGPIFMQNVITRIFNLQISSVFSDLKQTPKQLVCNLLNLSFKFYDKKLSRFLQRWKVSALEVKKIKNNYEKILRKTSCMLIFKVFKENINHSLLIGLTSLKSYIQKPKKPKHDPIILQKKLICIIMVYQNMLRKKQFRQVSKAFRTMKNPGSKTSSQFMFIDPSYKIEIRPPEDSLEKTGLTPILSQSFNSDSEYAWRKFNDSCKIVHESNSPSMESMTGSGDLSPQSTLMREVEILKSRVAKKTPEKPVKVNQKSKNSPVVNSAKKPILTVKTDRKSLEDKKKSVMTREPITPPIAFNRGKNISFQKKLTNVVSENINLNIPNGQKSGKNLCNVLVKSILRILSEEFKKIMNFRDKNIVNVVGNGKDIKQEDMKRKSVRNREDTVASNLWKKKLLSLGVNKFYRTLSGVVKKNMVAALASIIRYR